MKMNAIHLRLCCLGLLLLPTWPLLGPSTAAAQPAGLRYDDGYVYLAATNHPSREEWYLSGSARLLGTGIARGSAFKFVLKQGRRVLSTTVCEGRLNWYGRSEGAPDRMFVSDCIDRDQPLTATGMLSVDVVFLDDDSGEETLLRTHPLDVRSLTRERLGGQPSPSHFFVNHHAEAAAMFIEQVPWHFRRAHAEINQSQGSEADRNNVYLNFRRSPEGNVRQTKMRCSVDGQRVDLGDDDIARPVRSGRNRSSVIQVLKVQGQVRVEQDPLMWEWEVIQLPLTFGTGDGADWTPYLNMNAHPGRWECLLRRDDRRVIRRFAFTVGADGLVQPHAEEAAGLVLHPGAHLVDGVIPDDSPIDQRTDPRATRAGAFFGRAWATPEGRAIGAGIPAIGEPFPSTGRARRGRGNRGRRR